GGNGTITAISPLVDIRAELNQEPALDLFVVNSGSFAARWRQVALDDFDGAAWTLNADTTSSLSPAPEPTPTIALAQKFRLTALVGKFLPAAYRAVDVSPPV